MSYSLRNTILLAIVLILFAGGGSAWLYFVEYGKVKEATATVERQKAQMASLEQEVERYQPTFRLNEELNHRLDNYPKSMLPGNRLSALYEYVRRADPGSTFMNFAFTDSTQMGDYGLIRFTVDGAIDYRQLRTFIHSVESAKPLVKFTSLQIRPTNNSENLHEVGFRVTAEAFYDRTGRDIQPVYAETVHSEYPRNPFFPLVHDIPANTDNLIDVERSRLTAMGSRNIYLIDQHGQLQRLGVRDRVHLGYLESISSDQKSATFFLNKGGLVERVTMRIKQ